MSTTNDLGSTLVKFARDGSFPDSEDVSATRTETSSLAAALEVLKEAKEDLEKDIRLISRDQPPEVDSWIQQAQGIQDDINKTKSLASQIVRDADAGDDKLEALEHSRHHVEFLTKETLFNNQLWETLKAIKRANDLMDEAEVIASEKHILGSLHKLTEAGNAILAIKIDHSIRAKTLLRSRLTDLSESVHENFMAVWASLVSVNFDRGFIEIHQVLDHDRMTIDEAVIGLELFGEVVSAAEKFWQQLDDAVLKPRTDLQHLREAESLASITIDGNVLRINDEPMDRNIGSLFKDLERIVRFLNTQLPKDFVSAVADAMMPVLAARIEQDWLRSSIPASLESMVPYQKVMAQVSDFGAMIEKLGWPGSEPFHNWVDNAPKNWLGKRRDDSLDYVRRQLSHGIDKTKKVKHVEKGMVSKGEKEQLGLIKNGETDQEDDEWGAWGSDAEEEPKVERKRSRHSLNETREKVQMTPPIIDDDETASWSDNWGFGDDDTAQADDTTDSKPQESAPIEKEITVSETYTISSIPQHVFDAIKSVLEDAAALSQENREQLPVSPAASGLFTLPSFILAMYRAVSPYHYSYDPSGNMYLYNDALYLSDQLKQYGEKWALRDDLPLRVRNKLKLEPEMKALEGFGKRAYIDEMNSHKTIIKDLMGGAQNFLLSSSSSLPAGVDESLAQVIDHVRRQAKSWKDILPPSAWSQAVGSLANTIASKMIQDVGDLDSLGAEATDRLGKLFNKITKLDDLFLVPGADSPQTAHYASDWLRMQFMGQVLQSTLADIRYLWFDSHLSVYFTAEQVRDLIELSFGKVPAQRMLIREIMANPSPVSAT
ncbi:is centromere binding protein at prophase [Phlyctema vagabunda]|uniref:Is centromere binding protein at prophase n=1 Tax=Phlyctema vagabunda TaxID=108571 RepID=A0ABR4P4G5_9HELO